MSPAAALVLCGPLGITECSIGLHVVMMMLNAMACLMIVSAAIDWNLLDETVAKGETFAVWPAERVPERRGSVKWRCKDTDGSVRLTDVNQPELTLFKAAGGGPLPAVIVCPGGAYAHLSYLHEGVEVAEWLAKHGIAAFVLKYRCPDQREAACCDIQRAISLVRSRADEHCIDTNRLGVMGFSAGAHLAAWASVNHGRRMYIPIDVVDAISCRPDFSVIVYPGLMLDERQDMSAFRIDKVLVADKTTPPSFILQTEDDFARVENSLAYYMTLKAAGVRVELHLFPDGGHGYGIRHSNTSVSGWEMLLEVWLRRNVLIKRIDPTMGSQEGAPAVI